MSEWIGVDLDGTLAEYHGWTGSEVPGPPIPEMVNRVKAWLAAGVDVRIFTARAGDERPGVLGAIQAWSLEHLGEVLPVTNVKDYRMAELWDDRAVSVEFNTGRQLAPSRRGL